MKIKAIRIENLRSFKDVTLALNDYTCLLGPNGSGKSTALLALNIFFRETFGPQTDCCNLSEEDFHCRNTQEPIKITVTFDDLNPKEQTDLNDYYRQGLLIISAVATWNESARTASVKQYGQRMSHPGFKDYYDALRSNAAANDLKRIFSGLRSQYSGLESASTKADMATALESYAAAHVDECVPLPSEDQFYGFQGANKLSPFIQWVYVPAVKDAATENIESKHTALGKLLARTVRRNVSFEREATALRERAQGEYQKLLTENQSALSALSEKLSTRIRDWAHPDASLSLQWRNDPSKSVTVADPVAEILAAEGKIFRGSLSRFGHGFQRSYLLALLQELSERIDGNEPHLILGCEEPELYQHPPQARHLATVFENLSKANSQIIVCTHSPHFVSAREFESIRMIRKDRTTGMATAVQTTLKDIDADVAKACGDKIAKHEQGVKAKIFSCLQTDLNEMFFAHVSVLVEGPEDRAYLATYLNLLGLWDEFRRRGCHIVPVIGKSKLVRPLAIAGRLSLPAFVVLDSDGDKYAHDVPKRTLHEKDNKAILSITGHSTEAPFPASNLFKKNIVVWKSDIGSVFKEEVTAEEYLYICNKVNAEYGHVGDLDKNELAIADIVTLAWDSGKKSASIIKACEAVVEFSRNT